MGRSRPMSAQESVRNRLNRWKFSRCLCRARFGRKFFFALVVASRLPFFCAGYHCLSRLPTSHSKPRRRETFENAKNAIFMIFHFLFMAEASCRLVGCSHGLLARLSRHFLLCAKHNFSGVYIVRRYHGWNRFAHFSVQLFSLLFVSSSTSPGSPVQAGKQ